MSTSAPPPPTSRAPATGRLDLALLLALGLGLLALLAPVLGGPAPRLDASPGGSRTLVLALHLGGLAALFLAARRHGLGPLTTALVLAGYALHPLRLGPLLGAGGPRPALVTFGLGLALWLGARARTRAAAWGVGLAALALAALPLVAGAPGPEALGLGSRLAHLPGRLGTLAFHEIVAWGARPFTPHPGIVGEPVLNGRAALGGLAVLLLAALARAPARRREVWLGLGVFVAFAAVAILAPDSNEAIVGRWSAPAGAGLWWALGALIGRATGVGALEVALLVLLPVAVVPATLRERAAWRDVETLARRALERDPEAWLAERQLAADDLARGRLSEADRRCRRVLAAHPADGEALELLGEIEIRRGLIPGQEAALALALRWLELATVSRPTSARAWGLMGEAHQRRGEREAAIAALQRSLDLDPDQALVATRLGMAHLEGNELEAAGAAFDRAVHVAPGDADALCGRGIVAYSAGRRDEARVDLAAALASEPDHVEARTILGRLAEESGDDATAERAYVRAVSVNPDYAEALYSLGALRVRLERFEAARPLLERLLAQHPGHVRAQVGLARVDLAAGAPARARAGLERVLARNPEHSEARALLAEVDAREGR